MTENEYTINVPVTMEMVTLRGCGYLYTNDDGIRQYNGDKYILKLFLI